MSVRPRGGDAYMVDVKTRGADGRVRRVRKVYRGSLKGARRFETELRRNLELGLYDATSEEVPTLEGFRDDYLASCTGNRASTIDRKRKDFGYMRATLGHLRLDVIGDRHISRYVARMRASGRANATINHSLATLRHALNTAHAWGYVEAVPKIKRLPLREVEICPLSEAESEALVECCGSLLAGHLRPMVILGLATGLRIGEMRALRWCDVDLERDIVHVTRTMSRDRDPGPPKGGSRRSIPLTRRATTALEGHPRRKGCALVFHTRDCDVLTYNSAKNAIYYASRKAGRPHYWHVLRHTFASRLVARGAPLAVVQDLMGHTTIELTRRYVHFGELETRAAITLLEDVEGQHRGNGPKEGLAKH